MGEGAGLIHFVQPSIPVTTWRTLWPALELRRRGYRVTLDTMDAGYVSDAPKDALTVVHLTPSIWAHEPWREKVRTVCRGAERLIVQIDDDWTSLDPEEGERWQ